VTECDLTGRTALVTGATGFIGGRLVTRLEQRGAAVYAISRQPPAEDGAVRWRRADVEEIGDVRRAISSVSPDVIFHLAGETHGARGLELVLPTFRINLLGTVNVLTATAETCPGARVVLAGSLEEPASGEERVSSPYAASKIGARAYAQLFRETMGLAVSVLRVFMVYGPGQRDLEKLVPYVILSLLRGEPPRLTSGLREVDWIYVDDVVEAFVASATADDLVASADVGTGEARSIRTLVARLVEIVDAPLDPEFGSVPDRPFEQVRIADAAATERALGWRPKITLDEGLRRTVTWYREQLELGLL
jgi:nucleoside-diphosphate-sugar epimerase